MADLDIPKTASAAATAQILVKFRKMEKENKPNRLTSLDVSDVFVENNGRLEVVGQIQLWGIKNPPPSWTEKEKKEFLETSGQQVEVLSGTSKLLLALQNHLFAKAPITRQEFQDLIKGGNVKDLLDEGDLPAVKEKK